MIYLSPKQLNSLKMGKLNNGLVTKSTGSWYHVLHDGKLYQCKIKGTFRMKGIKNTNPVTVGDIVDIEMKDNSENGLIIHLHPRKNYIIRKSTNLSKQAHIIAANIDQALLVITLACPETSTTFIDRYLASAEAYSITPVLIFNKVDLYEEQLSQYMEYLISVYEDIGYTCLRTSAIQKLNLDKFQQLLKDKTSLISGHSGVGKSTLINIIEPTLKLKTDEISHYHLKGKHTTTFSEMFQLSFGGRIIDTPGIKGFGMVEMEGENKSHYFPEMFKRIEECQYYNCTHTHEPNCAVKKALEDGDIAPSRYDSYLNIIYKEDDKYRKL